LLVRDANSPGCESSAQTAVLQNSESPTATIVVSAEVTCAGTDGIIEAIASGGNGQYTYAWEKTGDAGFSSVAKTLANVSAGEYVVTVTDGNSCTGTSSVLLDGYEPLVSGKDPANPTCPNFNNGAITLFATGGSGIYEYSIDNGISFQTDQQFTGLNAGLYKIVVRDKENANCEIQQTVYLVNPELPTITVAEKANPLCFGDANGTIRLKVDGGAGGYSFHWAPEGSTGLNDGNASVQTGLLAGSYDVTVTDKLGCQSEEADIVLTQNKELSVVYYGHQDIAIYGNATGMIEVATSGGNGAYSYSWSATNSVDNPRIENLSAGTYTVTVQDGNGCIDTYSRELVQPVGLCPGTIALAGNADDTVVCYGSAMPALLSVASASGGKNPLVYSWQFSSNLVQWADSLADVVAFTPSDSVRETVYARRKVTDDAGAVAFSNVLSVEKRDVPDVAIVGLAKGYCTNADSVLITGVPLASGANSVFGGSAGIHDNGVGTAWYKPLSVLAGEDTVLYTYTDEYGCSNTAKVGVAVYDTATIDIIIDRVVNIGSPEEPIIATPVGGVLTGPGVYAEDKKFLPQIAGLGTHIISYEYTTADGCRTRKDKDVVVATASARISGLPDNRYACFDDTLISLVAEGEIKQVLSFGGANVVLVDSVHATFNPHEAGVGKYQIEFKYVGLDDVVYTIAENLTVVALTTPNVIGFANRFCIDDASLVLKAIPAGGAFSGAGVSNVGGQYIFDPANAGVVDSSIAYTYTDVVSGCTIDTVEELHVYPLPKIETFTVRDLFNANEGSYEMAVSPEGGEFIVNGLSQGLSNVFIPSAVAEGTYSIQYHYTDANGCVADSVDETDVVSASGTFSAPSPVVCYDADPDTLVGTNPYGKYSVFSGGCVVNIGTDSAVFYPAIAGAGAHTIVYSYVGPDSIAQFSVSADVDVDSVGRLKFFDLEDAYCQDAGTIDFGAAPEVDGSIRKGNFSGNGVTNGVVNDGLARLVLQEVSAGDSTLVTYTYADTKLCSATASMWVTVNPLPQIDALIAKSVYNATSGSAELSALPDGDGGEFSSNTLGLIGATFSPDKEALGEHTVTYTYTDGNSCVSKKQVNFTIAKAEATIESIVLDRSYCDYAEPDTIIGNTWAYNTVGAFAERIGLRNIGENKAVVYPDSLGAGEFLVEFTYPTPDGLTEFSVSETISVESLSAVSISGLPSSFCVSDQAYAFSAGNSNKGGEHLFVYDGTAKGLSFSGTDAYFYPNLIDAGNYSVTYTYTSPSGCVVADTQNVSVYNLPEIDFDLKPLFNATDPAYSLQGIPSGGIFSGPGVSGDYFLPAVAGVQSNLSVEYYYVDVETNCASLVQHKTNVVQSEAAIRGIESVYCRYQTEDSLFGVSPEGVSFHYFYLDSLFVSSSDTLILKLDTLGQGEHSIRFEYAFADTTVLFYKEYTFEIYDIGSIAIDGLADEYCQSAQDVKLYGFPFGGQFVGSAISGDVYSPSSAGIGYDTVTYVYEKQFYDRYSVDAPEKQCRWDVARSIVVHALPEVSVAGIVDGQEICSNASPVVIVPNVRGGSFSGPSLFVDNDTAIFTPNAKIVGDRDIAFSYTDTNQCVNSTIVRVVVNPVAVLSFEGLGAEYCISENAVQLVGNQDGGYFYGRGIADADSSDGHAYFTPENAGIQLRDSVFYTYTNEFSCTAIIAKEVSVFALPDVSLSGFDDEYCQYDDDIQLVGAPAGSGGLYSVDGLIGANLKLLSTDVAGSHLVGYSYTDNNGCTDSVSAQILVHPAPIPSFELKGHCAEDSVVFYSTSASVDSVVNWSWIVGKSEGNNAPVVGDSIAKYRYGSGGDKEILLTVETENGCKGSIDSLVTLVHAPEIVAEWSKECGNNATVQFKEVTGTREGHLFTWDFGDGTMVKGYEPEHTYASPGIYTAVLTVNAESSCMVAYYLTVDVKPVVNAFPYLQDFEAGAGGWSQPMVDGSLYDIAPIGSWELATPATETLNSATSGSHAWVTNADGTYLQGEQSYVESPCFDLSGLEKPMVKFNMKLATDNGRDGAVVQVSVDNGYTWETLGDKESGLSWYNASGLVGNPGQQDVEQYGWTGAMADKWYSVRHSLDAYKGKASVRFRVAFGADGNVEDEGVVFDDFWLGERTKIVLLERFVGAGDKSQIADDRIGMLTKGKKLDVVEVAYHLGVDGYDPLYVANPEAGNSRATNYRIEDAPYLVVDGNYLSGSVAETVFDENQLQLRSLEDPLFNVAVASELSEGTIAVTVQVTALADIDWRAISLQSIVLAQNSGSSGNAAYKILPDAAGEQLKQAWKFGESKTFTYTYATQNANGLSFVAFVQDIDSKEIYQAAFDQTYVQYTTGLADIGADGNGSPYFYPVPATDKLYLGGIEGNDVQISVFSLDGMVVLQTSGAFISLNGIAPGAYVAVAETARGEILLKQVVFCEGE